MKEGEEEAGEGRCAPDVQKFGCRGTSVFAMGSSRNVSLRDEARLSGRIGRAFASAWFVWFLIRSGRPGVGARHLSILIACKRKERRACLMMVLIP